MPLGDSQDAGRQRRREQRRLAGGRRALENLLDVLGEPHVQHFVCLVQHEHANAVETQCLAADVVERAARRRHHDVRSAIEGANLLLHGRAAVERDDDDAGPVRIFVDRLTDLHRQLPRRDEHETCCGRGRPFPADEPRPLFVNAGGPSRTFGALSVRRVRVVDPARSRAGSWGGRRPRSCRCRWRPGQAGRCRGAGRGSSPAGPASVPRSRASSPRTAECRRVRVSESPPLMRT